MTIFQTPHFIFREFIFDDSLDCKIFVSDKGVIRLIEDGRFDFKKTSSMEMIKWFINNCKIKINLETGPLKKNDGVEQELLIKK